MMRLPEKIRRALEKIVREMSAKEDVYGLGLFGSWSRGDATTASDVDLLVLTKSDVSEEYVERIMANGLLIDLNFVPIKWIQGVIPPELDQKLFEVQIFYDRDWALTNVKLLMAKFYGSPERVDIRTNVHVMEADIHLSRATSALSKGDFLSAWLFASTAMENILKIPLEIALEPISNSRFIEKVEKATERLGLKEILADYMEMAGLKTVDKTLAEEKMKLFKTLWDEMYFTVRQNLQMVEKFHFKARTRIKYYFNPVFMQGVVLRAASIISAKNFAEAVHYSRDVFLSMLEYYAWLKSTLEGQPIDYTTLMRSMENLEKANPKTYQNMIKFLGLASLDGTKTNEIVEKARKNIVKLRMERKRLIKTHISKS
ncbi:MAG: nucleotidyltransferase domain-containing protein [Candidatus Bathyarchaeota archaeon]|nr:nucleotidyltransferase domain-containing protein [Candidatus Bathyarchaeota archaeon]MDW8022583.1 nucleotidyltransferase domain-containing protein [Nitrososphaerota archaeon]MDW8041031.1 nucleotidyltransferase domain-containing protein [Nitrososphaerota archaeon]